MFSEIVARLANLSFSEGIFPTMFKSAAVTLLLKKPSLDPDNPANYRPISNLNTISKIIERLFLSRFYQHVTSFPHFNTSSLPIGPTTPQKLHSIKLLTISFAPLIAVNQLYLSPWILALLLIPSTTPHFFHDSQLALV